MKVETYINNFSSCRIKSNIKISKFVGLDSIVSFIPTQNGLILYRDYTPIIESCNKLLNQQMPKRGIRISNHDASVLIAYGLLTKYQKDWHFLKKLAENNFFNLPNYTNKRFSLPIKVKITSPTVPKMIKHNKHIYMFAEVTDIVFGADLTKQGEYIFDEKHRATNIEFNLSSIQPAITSLQKKFGKILRLGSDANIGAVNIKLAIESRRRGGGEELCLLLKVTDPFANIFKTYKNFGIKLTNAIIRKYSTF